MDEKKQIRINYTNHKGKTTNRVIIPDQIWYGESPWHQGEQWFMKAFDVLRQAERDFALSDIHHIEPHINLENKKSKPTANNKLPSEVRLYTDGGSRGNPGASAIGYVVLTMDDKELHKDSKYLGITTNNQAEYQGLREGLEWCRESNIHTVHVHMDSLLVVNQMKGIYKIKNRDLWPIYEAIQGLLTGFNQVTFTHVPRELNKIADGMVNECLDDHAG